MRRLIKFLHTIGAIGLMGSTASLLALLSFSPPSTSLAGYALMRGAMAQIATWILLPSFSLTLIAGLLAIAANPAYHNAGWAWVKAATGILVVSASLQALSTMQDEARRSASAMASQLAPDTLATSLGAERGTLWVLLAVSTASVVLGIWRPRLTPARGHRMTTQKQPAQSRDLDVSE